MVREPNPDPDASGEIVATDVPGIVNEPIELASTAVRAGARKADRRRRLLRES